MCVVCLFAEFSVFENVHFDCEFCDSILILFLLFVFESVASSIFFSTLENLANENQSSASFFLMRKKESETEKEIVFTFCSFVCVFINSSTKNLLAFVFSVSESFEWSSAFWNSKKYEIVRKEKIKFLDEKIVIKSDVSNFCETNNSNSSSLNKSCVEIVEIEEEKEEKKSFLFWVLCYRLCFKWFSRRSNQKFVRRRFNHWKNLRTSENCF